MTAGVLGFLRLPFALLWACGFLAAPEPSPAAEGRDLPAACRMPPPDGGSCKALHTIAFYDPERHACDEAFYGGCGGVAPFSDIEDCRTACETGEALRLVDLRLASGTPYARLKVSFPRAWKGPELSVRVNDRPVDSRWVGGGHAREIEHRDLLAHLGSETPRKLSVTTLAGGRAFEAAATVHWSLAPEIFLLDTPGDRQALLTAGPIRLAVANSVRARVLHNGREVPHRAPEGGFRHGLLLEAAPAWAAGRNLVTVEASAADGRVVRREFSFVNLIDGRLAPGETVRVVIGEPAGRSGPFYRAEVGGDAVGVSEQEGTFHAIGAGGWLLPERCPVIAVTALRPGDASLRVFVKPHFTLAERLEREIRLKVAHGEQ